MEIYLSYSAFDRFAVEPFVEAMMRAFGKEAVFADVWLSQPSDGSFIEKNTKDEESAIAFLFVPKGYTGDSVIVEEWKDGLLMRMEDEAQLVFVLLDGDSIPSGFLQEKCLIADRANVDASIRKMVDIIARSDAFGASGKAIRNLKAYVTISITSRAIDMEIRPEAFMETSPCLVFVFEYSDVNNAIRMQATLLGDNILNYQMGEPFIINGGSTCIPYYLRGAEPLTAARPLCLQISDEMPFDLRGVLHVTEEGRLEIIPMVVVVPSGLLHLDSDIEVPLNSVVLDEVLNNHQIRTLILDNTGAAC